MERCECCDLPLEMCGKAHETDAAREARAERARLIKAGWVPAKYNGRCSGCDTYIVGDNTLIKHDDELGAWIGDCCA